MAHLHKILITEELSPNRIALLCLVKLYLDGNLRCRSRILRILACQLEGRPMIQNKTIKVTPSLRDLCQLFETACLDEKRHSSRKFLNEDLSIAQFQLLYLFWSMNTVEDLHRLIVESYSYLLSPSDISNNDFALVSPRSIIGRFVQKIAVAAKLLEFDESLLLYQSVCHYRASSIDIYENLLAEGFQRFAPSFPEEHILSSPLFKTWNVQLKNDASNAPPRIQNDDQFYENLNNQLKSCVGLEPIVPYENSSVSTIAKQDLELIVDNQIQLLEKHGVQTPPELKSIMKYMASPESEYNNVQKTHFSHLPSYHFLQYLEHLHRGDYHGAFDSLHQYFDYMVSKGSKYFYHFALISRASLHQYFGEDEKALDSIEEAISVARENKDNSTLTYVLSWLFNFMRRKPHLWEKQSLYRNSNELKILDFLIKKSQSVSLLLTAMSFKLETEYSLSSGGSFASYYESLFKSLYTSVHDERATFIKCCETASTVWNEVGYPHLSDTYNKIGLDYSEENGSTDELLALLLQKHYQEYSKGGPESSTPNLKDSVVKFANNAAQSRSLKARIIVSEIQLHLYKGRILQASELLKMLPNDEVLDEETNFEKLRLSVLAEAAHGNFSKSIDLMNRKLKDLSTRNYGNLPNMIWLIRISLLKALIIVQSNSNVPKLSLFVNQFQAARKLGFELALAEGLVTFVSFLNSSDYFRDAYNIGLEVLPVVIRTERQNSISTLYFELAKCCARFITASPKDEIPAYNSKDLFANLLSFLSKSISGFRSLSNLRMLRKCFELETEVAHQRDLLKEQLKRSKPFDDFIKHSQTGLEILGQKARDESRLMYLNS